jgi:hypothetical protein
MEIIIENLKSQRATLVEKYGVTKAQTEQILEERNKLEAEAQSGKIDSASEDYMLRMREIIDAAGSSFDICLKYGSAINKISQAINVLSGREVFTAFWG